LTRPLAAADAPAAAVPLSNLSASAGPVQGLASIGLTGTPHDSCTWLSRASGPARIRTSAMMSMLGHRWYAASTDALAASSCALLTPRALLIAFVAAAASSVAEGVPLLLMSAPCDLAASLSMLRCSSAAFARGGRTDR
jgi:hypothetical protein